MKAAVSINPNCTIPVFVYGSLLDGLGNHSVLKGNNYEEADFGGVFCTQDSFLMLSLGMFPGVINQTHLDTQKWQTYGPKLTCVLGEVWWVSKDMLATLDELEGHPNFYRRTGVYVRPWQNHNAVSAETRYELSLMDSEPGEGLQKNMVWLYQLPATYASRNYPIVDPLYGYNVRGVLSWAKVVTGENPPKAETI